VRAVVRFVDPQLHAVDRQHGAHRIARLARQAPVIALGRGEEVDLAEYRLQL
jgi:hypothetical protein